MKITFYGETPSKKNQRRIFCRGNRGFLVASENYIAWHTEQLYRLKVGRHEKVASPVSVSMHYWPSSLRRCDLSNRAESIMDTLVDGGIIEDDSWQHVRSLTIVFEEVDRKNPRMEVIINEIHVEETK